MPRATNETPASGNGPSGRRRGPRKGDLKEAAIVETAWRLLGEKPLSEMTIDDLAQGAGIHRSTFYFYFDSRDAVIDTMVSGSIEGLSAMKGVLANQAQPPDVGMRLLVYGLLGQWQSDAPRLRAMAQLSETDAKMQAFWDDFNDEIYATIAGWVNDERAAGRALPGPPEAIDLVRALSAMIWRRGYELSLRSPEELLDPTHAETLITIALRAVYGSTAPDPNDSEP